MEEDNVAIRLKGFIQSQGLTNSQFADTCGIPRPSLSQLLSGRNKKISDVIVGQIHQAYPELSVLWLLFGEGDMLRNDNPKTAASPDQTPQIGQSGSQTLNLFCETEMNPMDESGAEEYSNHKPLNMGHNEGKPSKTQRVNEDLKSVELMRQIEKMKRNPRKVTQITVYYDDSTFETFYPKR